jgi:LAO/AO transport system kinase
VALSGEGVPQLVEKLEEHRHFIEEDTERKKKLLKATAEAELAEAIKERTVSSILDDLRKEGKFEELLQKILKREIDPASAAEKLLNERLRKH